MNIDNFSKHADTSKDKLQMIVACTQIVLRYVREHPVAGGVALLLTGGSITISAPLIIGIGTSACVTGELVISIAVWLGGTGVVIGSVNRSGETVRQSLYAGGIIGAIGAGIYVTGIFLKLSGYVMILYGGALTLIGLGMFTSGLRQLRSSQKQYRDAIAQSAKDVLVDLHHKKNQDEKTDPV